MIERVSRWSTIAGLGACVAGFVILLLASAGEVSAGTAQSLEDGYLIGRLPWIAVGVDLVVIGTTVAVIAGTLSAWIAGRWIRRTVTAGALVVPAFWWSVALLPPSGGAYCPTCAPAGPDPLTYAYSLPESALALLVLPALVAGVAALTAPRRRPLTETASAT